MTKLVLQVPSFYPDFLWRLADVKCDEEILFVDIASAGHIFKLWTSAYKEQSSQIFIEGRAFFRYCK